MDDEAIDVLRVIVARWAGRTPQRVTVREWLREMRQLSAAGSSGREPVAWRIERGGNSPILTDNPATARMYADLGDRVIPLYGG